MRKNFFEWMTSNDTIKVQCTGELGTTIRDMLQLIKKQNKSTIHLDPDGDNGEEIVVNGEDVGRIKKSEIIEIETKNKNKIKELLEKIRSLANPGHSYNVTVLYDDGRKRTNFDVDGDGSDHILNVKV